MANIREICLVLVLAFVVVTTGNPFIGHGGIFRFDGCLFKRCHRYAKCVITKSYRAVCVCPKPCPKSLKPVCGTDWKTYNNYCELAKKSCAENSRTLRLRYYGPCKSGSCRLTRWESLRCPYYSICQLNYGLPSCICARETCPSSYKPVCGSDGRTYRNRCELRKAGCKQRKWLHVKHPGHCRPDPCALIDCCCRAQCRVNKTNHARCECNFACTLQFDPVCGSDGRTYGNACGLSSAACAQQNPKLVVVSNGQCPTPTPEVTTSTAPITLNPCSVIKCGFFAKCDVINGSAGCSCPSLCPAVEKRVCGSNGVTYNNVCELQRDSCKNKQFIKVAHEGPCPDPCALIDCCCRAQCRVNKTNHARCECNFACTLQFDPVCGSDGRTYGNACGLSSAACAQQNPKLVVVSNGQCPTPSPEVTTSTAPITLNPCSVIKCGFFAKCEVINGSAGCSCPSLCPAVEKRVCGSNGVTYNNVCELQRDSCKNKQFIKVAHEGPCPDPCALIDCCCRAQCRVNETNHARCECNFACTLQFDPVCGSDGRTYGNACGLSSAACAQQNPKLVVVSNGQCPTPTPDVTTSTAPVTLNPCSVIKCGFFAKCEVINGSARCVCPSICLNVHNLMCGSDGVTYGNLCELQKASCDQQKHITVIKRGVCGPTFSCPIPRICHVFCDKEECAKRGQICCCRGCGNVCTTPIKPFGRDVCPPNDNQCLTDESCSNNKKCCFDGCSKRCVKPVVSVDTEMNKMMFNKQNGD